MKTPRIENVVADATGQWTYVVMAHRVLTDGELYSAIRVDILRHGRRVTKGEPLVITASNVP